MNKYCAPQSKKKRVLLYGAGVGANLFIRQIKLDRDPEILIIGIIDDDEGKKGCVIHGIKVLGGKKDLIRAIDEKRIDEVIITIATDANKLVDGISELLEKRDVSVKIIPSEYELKIDENRLTHIHNVDVEDLLGRDIVSIDFDFLAQAVQGKTILITGGGGSIGKALAQEVVRLKPKKVIILDADENAVFWTGYDLGNMPERSPYSFKLCNICEKEKVRRIITREEPDIIFHAAAFKHVPLSYEHPCEYVLNNVLGTKNIIEIVKESDFVKKFCLISTDKAVNPSNVMGATKALCERLVLSEVEDNKDTRFCFVRFGNVLGTKGSVLKVFKDMIVNRQTLKITDEHVERYFMGVQEAVNLVLHSVFMKDGQSAFLLDMGDSVKIIDLARLVIRLSGLKEKDIAFEYTGLRLGEKMTEELFDPVCEKLAATSCDKIFSIGRTDESNFRIGINQIFDIIRIASAAHPLPQ